MQETHCLQQLKLQAELVVFKLLALQSPVVGDLRTVVASLQNVTDADRMGALALHVAKFARRRHARPCPALPCPRT